MAQSQIHLGMLRNVPLFAVLNETQMASLAGVMTHRVFAKQRNVMQAGDRTDSLYIIIHGRVNVQMADDEGKEVILASLGPGEFFGEMGLLDDEPRAASVVTTEACDFVVITQNDFHVLLKGNFDLAMLIMRGLVKRLREADRHIESLALLDVYGRIARVLIDRSEEVGGQRIVKDHLPRQDIAKMIGASREMVSRVMKGLEVSGHIEVRDDGSTLLRERLSSHI